MKAMNFKDDISSSPIDILKDHYVPVFDFTSLQDVTDNIHFPEVVGKPRRLELKFTFPVELVTELSLWEERISSVAVDKLDLVGENIEKSCFTANN